MIHVAERDTQRAALRKQPGEFVNTWSVDGFISESLQPAELVWGTHERFWDGPIQEVNDYVATMTSNMISERTERTNATWVRTHYDLFNGYAVMRNSPGEANRAEAAGLAWRIDNEDEWVQRFIGIVRGRTERSSRG